MIYRAQIVTWNEERKIINKYKNNYSTILKYVLFDDFHSMLLQALIYTLCECYFLNFNCFELQDNKKH